MRILVAALVAILAIPDQVNDLAGILRPEDASALQAELADVERTDSTQVVVLTVRTTSGVPIESYALQIARDNGIGQKGKNNGILVVVAAEDRTCRIEVGYGLEGKVPDTVAALIIEHEMIPRFRNGDLSGGTRAGVEAVIRAVRGEYQATPSPFEGARDLGFGVRFGAIWLLALVTALICRFLGRWWIAWILAPGWIVALHFVAIVAWSVAVPAIFIATGVGTQTRRGGLFGWRGSGSSAGAPGGFSGGGGGFGGGGSSGKW